MSIASETTRIETAKNVIKNKMVDVGVADGTENITLLSEKIRDYDFGGGSVGKDAVVIPLISPVGSASGALTCAGYTVDFGEHCIAYLSNTPLTSNNTAFRLDGCFPSPNRSLMRRMGSNTSAITLVDVLDPLTITGGGEFVYIKDKTISQTSRTFPLSSDGQRFYDVIVHLNGSVDFIVMKNSKIVFDYRKKYMLSNGDMAFCYDVSSVVYFSTDAALFSFLKVNKSLNIRLVNGNNTIDGTLHLDKSKGFLFVSSDPSFSPPLNTQYEIIISEDTIMTDDSTYVIPKWNDGAFSDIQNALKLHDDGYINLYDYWSVGDEKTINFTSMSQDVDGVSIGNNINMGSLQFIIVDKNVVDTESGEKCHFVIASKDCLAVAGKINSDATNEVGWSSSKRRTWLNSTFKNSLPTGLQTLIKPVEIKTAKSGSDETIESTVDHVFLPCEYNVFATNSYSAVGEDNVQWEYYTTQNNRIKKVGNSANGWWLRSPRKNSTTEYVATNANGLYTATSAANSIGVSPTFCI